jgi:hypothetical protein
VLLLRPCCCWGPTVVDIHYVPGVSTVVGIRYVVGVPAVWLGSCCFSIHAIVDVSDVVGGLLLLKSFCMKNRTTMILILMYLTCSFFLYFVFASSIFLCFASYNFRSASDFDCFSSMQNRRKRPLFLASK